MSIAGLFAVLARRSYAALLLFCIVLWTPGILSLPALDRDESRFAQASRQMLESGNFVDIRFGIEPRYKKPVGIYWLQAATTAAAGFGRTDAIWTYRLASLVGGVVAVWLTFWCASAITGAEGALVAAALMAASLLLTAEATIATTDSVLLATVIGVQGVWLRVYRAARDPAFAMPSTTLLIAGWAAFAAGILLKGPVLPGVSAVTVLALVAWDRRELRQAGSPQSSWRWLLRLRLVLGLLVTFVLVAPWLVAIVRTSHGAFLSQSLGGDFASKLAGGQESHGAPPGYYLLLAALTFWPGILFVAPGIGLAWSRHGEPAIRFLLAWAGASWAMFEIVPTKLPHYVLPLYPALAMFAALWLCGEADTPRWPRLLRIVSGIQFLLGLVLFTAAPVLLPRLYSVSTVWWLAALASVGALLAVMALFFFIRDARRAGAVFALLAMLVFVPTLTLGVGPRLDRLWVSERLAALVRKDAHPSDPPPLAAGYEEPSLMFALDAGLRLTDGRGAAETGAAGGGLALVEDRERSAFLARLAEIEGDATAVDELSGFDYSRGHAVHITLFRVTGPHDSVPSRLP